MSETCSYPIDRDETLVAYLYDDIDPVGRAAFEAHMTSCVVCREELVSLQSVRQRLARWAPPEPHFAVASPQSPVVGPGRQSWWREIPAWAQVAAALLFLGVSAGVANLDIRYDQNGLTVRTGWAKPSLADAAPSREGAQEPGRADVVSRAELAALEQRLRNEVRALQAHAAGSGDAQTVSTQTAAPLLRQPADADLMRRVRALVDDGEKRQQRELALRVGEVLRDINAQRQSDLMRIDRSLGLVENNLGVEVLKQRERVNYLMRVNQRQ